MASARWARSARGSRSSLSGRTLPGVEPGSLEGRLLALVEEARQAGTDAETELRAATTRLRHAFQAQELPPA